ncbi:protein PSK SIMULATOR 1-like [Zingiber officinale]|uniref:protein PSK SIMULATOR 1-like n=1 Tax=Zingiber officinale TaxID=94328 RepID=UPI001C4C9C9C|nr:protein PSK SIMULATOR 1-like [Zingiber officinale]XP_042459103.1 protein PSK SIMULATOR 1-like [Zingiber officinale]XP_042459104.1 protein PSK SIMULATOR 1-like [Zingiber officinale]
MGGTCSKRSAVDKSPSDTLDPNGRRNQSTTNQSRKTQRNTVEEAMEKQLHEQPVPGNSPVTSADETESQFSRSASQNSSRLTNSKHSTSVKSGTTKVSEVSSVLGKAGSMGLGKAVEVLDTLGTSVTNLHLSSSFMAGMSTKGNKIAILSFEVANTIVKGSNLMQSVSEENIKHLKEVVLPSEGVQHLISRDMDELLSIAIYDKREEFDVFCNEVVRFGNRCKDPQWHNLERYFNNLTSELTPINQLKEAAGAAIEQLLTLAQHTAELYHEFHTLDRFEQDSRRKQQEDDSASGVQRGDNLQILKQELKSQRKHVKSLKKRSLWSKNLEEVLVKLVDIVHFIHLKINDAFGNSDTSKPAEPSTKFQRRLGPAGLALHYANIITQIDTLVSRSSSVPQNTRDSLYQGLPPNIKSTFRSKLQLSQTKEELSVPQIKLEMEKTLQWLVPFANNTTKAHHGFGWVGEWANTSSDISQKAGGQVDLLRIETLHHADKGKTDAYILDLVLWLHHLVRHSKSANGEIKSPIKSPVRSPTNGLTPSPASTTQSSPSSTLTQEDQEMLQYVNIRKLTPGISRSQEFNISKSKPSKHKRLSKSNSHSPTSCSKNDFFTTRRPSLLPVIDFDIDRVKAMDVIDRVADI